MHVHLVRNILWRLKHKYVVTSINMFVLTHIVSAFMFWCARPSTLLIAVFISLMRILSDNKMKIPFNRNKWQNLWTLFVCSFVRFLFFFSWVDWGIRQWARFKCHLLILIWNNYEKLWKCTGNYKTIASQQQKIDF